MNMQPKFWKFVALLMLRSELTIPLDFSREDVMFLMQYSSSGNTEEY